MNRIICFLCGRSAKDALESAVLDGWSVPEGMQVIELPCSGRLDVHHILRSFTSGADGVIVVGCLDGNCQYHSGSYEARKRVDHAKTILRSLGVDDERLEMFNISSNQGWKVTEIVREMEGKLTALNSWEDAPNDHS